MKKITYKRYAKKDLPDLLRCSETFQDYLTSIDPMHRTRRLKNYGKIYSKNLLKKIRENRGVIIMAYDRDRVAGFISGYVEKQTPENLLECVPTRAGKIKDLFVFDAYRKAGIGKNLMHQMERYFCIEKCDIVRISVFTPNRVARKFYRKRGYHERLIYLIKKI